MVQLSFQHHLTLCMMPELTLAPLEGIIWTQYLLMTMNKWKKERNRTIPSFVLMKAHGVHNKSISRVEDVHQRQMTCRREKKP